MRLLYLVNARIPTEKAHGLQIAKTIEAMGKFGVEVKLMVPWRKNHLKTKLEIFYNLKSKIDTVYIPDPLRLIQTISEPLYFPLQRLWFGVAAFFYALFWQGIIYSRDITVSFFLSLFGKRVVYEDHQPKQRFRFLYSFFLRTIPCKVIVAQNLAAQYQAMRVSKSSYVLAPNGVDIEEFNRVAADRTLWNQEFGIAGDRTVVLYIGHFYSWKGVYTLLDAAQYIQAAIVLLGGTDKDYETLARHIKERNINNVYLHPFVPHREVIQYLKSADALILPNTAAEERSQRYTTPIKLFEYMASGVPIVASNILSFTPYLKDKKNAILFEPDNPNDLAKAVNQLAQNRGLGEELARAARESINQYTWDSRVQTIISFI